MPSLVQLCSAASTLLGAFRCHIYLSNHHRQATANATNFFGVALALHYYLFLQLSFFVRSLHLGLFLFFQRIEIVIYAGLDFT